MSRYRHKKGGILRLFWGCMAAMLLCPGAASGDSPGLTESLFMGEDLSVVTIASGRRESAFEAPAIVNVVTPGDVKGYADPDFETVFSFVPGAYVNQNQTGSRPYLRGIPDSVLWLYNGVPMDSGITRESWAFNQGLYFSGIKQLEVVRGPGSVLWGPDAFAGVANLVPLTARDFQGMGAGVLITAPDPGAGAFVNYGSIEKDWDIFLNANGAGLMQDDTYNTIRFNTGAATPAPPDVRYGSSDLPYSRSAGFTGNFTYNDRFDFMIHATDNTHYFVQHNADSSLSWQEMKKTESLVLSAATKMEVGTDTLLRVKTSFSGNKFNQKIIDYDFSYDETTFFVESLLEKSLFKGGGSLVAGCSARIRDINDAPVWDAYLPDYLGSDNLSFLPRVSRVSVDYALYSLFSRYYYKSGPWGIWGGVRFDMSDLFDDVISFSGGLSRELGSHQILKLACGTAYRTPVGVGYEMQDDPVPEKIETLSLQYTCNPLLGASFGISAYVSGINDRRADDPYLGVSNPDDFNVKGLEFEFSAPLAKAFSLKGVAAVTQVDDAYESYRYNDYTIVGQDGSLSEHYITLGRDMAAGPQFKGKMIFSWEAEPALYIFTAMEYISSTKAVSVMDPSPYELEAAWLMDIGFKKENFLGKDMTLVFSVENLLDHSWQVAGKYGPVAGKKVQMSLMLKKAF